MSLDNFYLGYPIAMAALFKSEPDLEKYFLSLPEETQKALISEDIHSPGDLHDCIEQFKLKE